MSTWDVIGILLKILIVVGIGQGTVAYLILVERKIAAWAQDRIGPNRAGPFGLLQPLADGAKMFLKEDVVPSHVDKTLYILAPIIAITMATIAFAVVPFGPVGNTGVNVWTPWGWVEDVQFQIAPGIDVGIVYIFAIGSLAVY